jgi:hypothetical protein
MAWPLHPYEQYTSMANRHQLGKPRRNRNGEPLAPRAWREEMMSDGPEISTAGFGRNAVPSCSDATLRRTSFGCVT